VKRVLVLVPFLFACRGQVTSRPPIHLIDDMDHQPKYRPEAASHYFADGRTMRAPVEETVAIGQLHDDDPVYTGESLDHLPLAATAELAHRGGQRFDIYCAPCHDRSASGHGMVVQRGFPPPIDLASERVRKLKDGEIFGVITHGVRNMPSYAAQIPARDRWAIVLWLRVLERSQHATIADVPAELRDRIESETAP
jgi:hypothetical protein